MLRAVAVIQVARVFHKGCSGGGRGGGCWAGANV